MDPAVRRYLARIGARGGQKSRRALSGAQAREMVQVREARRAFRRFHTRAFWSFDPGYRITARDVAWVAERLMTHGGREGWDVGAKLCR